MGFKIFNKTKIVLLALTFITLINLSLYKFHPATNDKITEIWIKFKFKSVDQFNIAQYEKDDLRVELANLFPYSKTTEPIPRQIWQMWKTTDMEKIEPGLKDLVRTWSTQENFTYCLFDDDFFEGFIYRNFHDAPRMIEGFNKLPVTILKSDLMRYLVLFAYGGVYSDIDTSLITPLDSWTSYNNSYYEENQIGLTIGIESDRDDKEWFKFMPRRMQFCQWTLQSKSGHPFFRELIYRIINLSLNHYDSKTKILKKDGKEYDFNDGSKTKYAGIMEWTGPGMFTDTVFDYLNDVLRISNKFTPNKKIVVNPNPKNVQSQIKYQVIKDNGLHENGFVIDETPFGWQNLTHITEPLIINDDVLLLPQVKFADHSDPHPNQYVKHHFKGSWKKGLQRGS